MCMRIAAVIASIPQTISIFTHFIKRSLILTFIISPKYREFIVAVLSWAQYLCFFYFIGRVLKHIREQFLNIENSCFHVAATSTLAFQYTYDI